MKSSTAAPTTMSFASVVKIQPKINQTILDNKDSLCENSYLSELKAFEFLELKKKDQIISEKELSLLFPRKKVPDAIFKSKRGNIAIEVKRIKNMVHKDTVQNALNKVHADMASFFSIKEVHLIFQTREEGQRDKICCVLRDVHGIIKKQYKVFPYELEYGSKLFVHVQKVKDDVFKNIGF